MGIPDIELLIIIPLAAAIINLLLPAVLRKIISAIALLICALLVWNIFRTENQVILLFDKLFILLGTFGTFFISICTTGNERGLTQNSEKNIYNSRGERCIFNTGACNYEIHSAGSRMDIIFIFYTSYRGDGSYRIYSFNHSCICKSGGIPF